MAANNGLRQFVISEIETARKAEVSRYMVRVWVRDGVLETTKLFGPRPKILRRSVDELLRQIKRLSADPIER